MRSKRPRRCFLWKSFSERIAHLGRGRRSHWPVKWSSYKLPSALVWYCTFTYVNRRGLCVLESKKLQKQRSWFKVTLLQSAVLHFPTRQCHSIYSVIILPYYLQYPRKDGFSIQQWINLWKGILIPLMTSQRRHSQVAGHPKDQYGVLPFSEMSKQFK